MCDSSDRFKVAAAASSNEYSTFFFCLHKWNGLLLELMKKGKAHVEGKREDKLKEILVCRY